MKKSKTKAPTGAACTSTVNTMKCALTGEHDVHRSSAERRGQYLTWQLLDDGRYQVTPYSGKKKQGGWVEAAPKAAEPERNEQLAKVGYCGAKFESNTIPTVETACTLAPGHKGPHENTSTGARESAWTASARDEASKADHAAELERETTSATGGHGAQGEPASVDGAADADGIVDMKQTAGRHLSEIKVHPAADVFPMLDGPEYEELREDIRRNGVRVRPVLDADGLLVDGRNRKRACDELGIAVEYDRLPPGVDVLDFVISANIKRRHLHASQKAMFAEAVANLRPGRPKETGSTAGLTQAQAAERFGVSERSIREARVVRENAAPEVVQAVHQGKLSVDAAAKLAKLPHEKQKAIYEREIKPKKQMVKGGKIKALTKQEEKRAIVRKINEGHVAPMPAGEFGLIYGDYPWPFDNSDQHEGSRGHMDYPGMPMPEILTHAREAAKRASRDCIVALWYVDSFFNEIRDVLAAYGATPRRQWVWDKCTKNDKDKSGVGTWGRPRHEILVIASIGNPTHTLNEVDTLIRSPIREPGRKPDVVAELLQKHCAGPFLELFAREPRNELWSVWGAETDKFATEAA